MGFFWLAMMRRTATVAMASVVVNALGATFFVSPTGNDQNSGAKESPFATITQGQASAKAGDTVFFRGGTYAFKSTTEETGITLNKSGSAEKRIHYFAYAGEKPVFDFYGLTAQKRVKGVLVTANWIHLKGFEMKGVPQSAALQAHENWCIYVNGGSDNVFEQLNLHHNMGPGFFIKEGGNNLILNCDSHDNYDINSFDGGNPTPGENADGFGVHVTSTSAKGNVFRGCRAWWNADDGWDFINCSAAVIVENCWAWGNGYKTGTNPPQSAGNGNGFKIGGYGMPPANTPSEIPKHTVRFCLGFNNKAAGFYQNHHPIANFYYNNTGYNNKASNFNLLGYDLTKKADAGLGVLRNNIAFTGTALSGGATDAGVDDANNSWNLSVTVSSADFESVDTAGVGGPRQADGNLPDLRFLKLKQGSDLIDKGANVGLAHQGTSPDLGAYEYGQPTSLIAARGRAGRVVLRVSQAQSEGLFEISGRRILSREIHAPIPGVHAVDR